MTPPREILMLKLNTAIKQLLCFATLGAGTKILQEETICYHVNVAKTGALSAEEPRFILKESRSGIEEATVQFQQLLPALSDSPIPCWLITGLL